MSSAPLKSKLPASTALPPPAVPVKEHKSTPAAASAASAPAEPKQDAASTTATTLDIDNPDPEIIDFSIFSQLLEMDDDDEHSFSRPLVEEYIEQAKETLTEMEECLSGEANEESLLVLSEKGHFLKGSSAALGVIKVRDSCEILQHLGRCNDEKGDASIPLADAYKRCSDIMPSLQSDYLQATKWLEALCGIEPAA